MGKVAFQFAIVIGKFLDSGFQFLDGLFSVLKLLTLGVEILYNRKMTVGSFSSVPDLFLCLLHFGADRLACLPSSLYLSLQGFHPLFSSIAPILVHFVVGLVVLKLAKLLDLFFPQHFEIVNGFGVFHRLEDLIKTFFQGGWFTQRPKGFVLMTEDNGVKNCRRDTKTLRYHLVKLSLSGRSRCSFSIVNYD
ncbi:hypothetical protein HG530_004255 [Fusarium avenaceum]|nr:hypothetical protein HG530_004255 [Fusarium avenaceum]